MEEIYSAVAEAFEMLGAISMVAGFVVAGILSVRALLRQEGGSVAFHTLRTTVGGAILLGLEVLVAADLLRTITSKPSVQDAVILGLIVIIRTILSMSIQIELEGVLPWKRALLTSGGHLIAQELKLDRQKSSGLPTTQQGPRQTDETHNAEDQAIATS